MLRKKADLEREKKALEDLVAEKDAALRKKIKTIGNYVHDSVPVSNDEVRQETLQSCLRVLFPILLTG